MGLFGKMIKDAVINGITQGIRTTQFSNLFGISGSNNSLSGIDYQTSAVDDYPYGDLLNTSFATNKPISSPDNVGNIKEKFKTASYSGVGNAFVNDDNSDRFYIKIPSWGYNDYINERNIWIRHLSSGLDEQNWLYFRIFFNFDTDHGILGGILNNTEKISINSANKYLNSLNKSLYKVENIDNRIKSLDIFVRTLSTINTLSPWIFKGISNINSAANPTIDDFSKEKSINLEFNPDTVDFRLSTMFSAYKYACFDDYNTKEIIPENLRKFDMTVVIFSLPIKYIHTPTLNSTDTILNSIRKGYKKLYDSSNPANIMSMKILSFYNCEFDKEGLGGYIPSALTSDSPFQLGKNSIKITYDRVMETLINEYDQIMINSIGLWEFDQKENSTLNLLAKTRNQMTNGDILLSASDAYITYKLNETFGTNKNFILGNIYGQDAKIYQSSLSKTHDKYSQSSLTDYFKSKVAAIKGNKNLLIDIGYNMLYNLLGSSYRYGEAPGNDGSGTVLNGQGQLGVGSSVFKSKMERIKYGGFTNNLLARENRLNAIDRADNFSIGKYLQQRINRK